MINKQRPARRRPERRVLILSPLAPYKASTILCSKPRMSSLYLQYILDVYNTSYMNHYIYTFNDDLQ